MPSIFDTLLDPNDTLDDPTRRAATAAALRRQYDYGTIGQLMGIEPTMRVGQSAQDQAFGSLRAAMDKQRAAKEAAARESERKQAQANADRFMCPQCGAKMVFAPDDSGLICEHCTSGHRLGAGGAAEEQDFLIAMATARGHGKPVAMQIFHCKGCGAEFILAPDIISSNCAYSDSPHVVSLGESRELLQPEGVIPQAFNQKQATKLLVDWVEGNDIKPQGKVDLPRGIYLPIWTFDIGGVIDYSGDVVQAEGEFYGRGQTQVVHVRASHPVYIDDLPLPASRKIARHISRLLPSFDLKHTQPYDPRYLSNWAAEVYNVPMADASLDARSRAYNIIKRRLPGEIASLYNLVTSSANLTIESFKLVLVPVWITEIPVDGKKLLVLINGQNGVVQGDMPKQEKNSKSKNGLFEWLEDLLDG